MLDAGTITPEVTRCAAAKTATADVLTTSDACRIALNLIRQVAEAREEREMYRKLVCGALTLLHEKNRDLERERASRYRLIGEFRALQQRKRVNRS